MREKNDAFESLSWSTRVYWPSRWVSSSVEFDYITTVTLERGVQKIVQEKRSINWWHGVTQPGMIRAAHVSLHRVQRVSHRVYRVDNKSKFGVLRIIGSQIFASCIDKLQGINHWHSDAVLRWKIMSNISFNESNCFNWRDGNTQERRNEYQLINEYQRIENVVIRKDSTLSF